MKLGAENKRNVIILSVLGLVAAYGIYSNFSDSELSSPPAPKPAASTAQAPVIGSAAPDSEAPAAPRTRARNEEWHPMVHPKNKEDQVPPDKIDPTLRLDLLAQVMESKQAGSDRNLFEFGKAAPKVPDVPPEPVIKKLANFGPPDLPVWPPPPPPPPPPTPMAPINAKYYGWATPSNTGRKRGFFLDGDEPLIKAEGEMLTKDYKVIKLESGQVVLQEVASKRTKTLPIEPDATF